MIAMGQASKNYYKWTLDIIITIITHQRQTDIGLLLLPDAPRYVSRVVYSYKFVVGGRLMEIRLLLVWEERVGYPNVFDKFRFHGQRFYTQIFRKRQTRIVPILSEVEIQREVLCEV